MYQTPPKGRKASLLFMNFDYSVNYWNVSSLDFKDHDFTSSDRVFPEVGEEQKVAPVEGRLHAATGKRHVTSELAWAPKGNVPTYEESNCRHVSGSLNFRHRGGLGPEGQVPRFPPECSW